jgi:hypothetical protein
MLIILHRQENKKDDTFLLTLDIRIVKDTTGSNTQHKGTSHSHDNNKRVSGRIGKPILLDGGLLGLGQKGGRHARLHAALADTVLIKS